MQLTPQILIQAYCCGIFPMAEDNQIYWFEPNPRGLIPLDQRFHVPKSLRRFLAKEPFRYTVDYDFRGTMEACATAAPGRESTWINHEFLDVYLQLHQLGLAHSVETWQGDQIVGGLYGVAIKGLFAGESMWSSATNASKAALVFLVERLRAGGYRLLDTQWTTAHLKQFGAYDVPRSEYLKLLAQAIQVDATFFPESEPDL